jgi:uncharacterized MAPEG superfamily protein
VLGALADWFTWDRRKALPLSFGGALATGLAAVLLAWALGPVDPAAAQLAVPAAPALAVFALSLAVAFARLFTHRWDPLSHQPGRSMQVLQRALTNSVEQGLVFAGAGLAVALQATPAEAGWLCALALLYLAGRAGFVAGYLIGPFARAPGMAATLTVNLAVLILLARALVA